MTSRVVIGANCCICALTPCWHSKFFTGLVPCIPMLRLAAASLLQTRQLLTIYEDNCSCASANAQPPGRMSYIPFILNRGKPLRIHHDDHRCPRPYFLLLAQKQFPSPANWNGNKPSRPEEPARLNSTMRHYQPQKFGQFPGAGNLHWHLFSSFPFCDRDIPQA